MRKIKCTYCNASFQFKATLMNHIKSNHTPYSRGSLIFRCSVCEYHFHSVYELMQHFKTLHIQSGAGDNTEAIAEPAEDAEMSTAAGMTGAAIGTYLPAGRYH